LAVFKPEWVNKMLLYRIMSGVLGIVLLIIVINFTGKIPFFILVLITAILAVSEFFNAVFKDGIKKVIKLPVYILGSGLLVTSVYYPNSLLISLFIILTFLLLCIIYIFTYNKLTFIEINYAFFGFVYIFGLISHMILLRSMNNGILLVWFALISVWVNDSFAYFIGSKYGRRRLRSNISPNKTVEGSIGGLAGSITVSVLFLRYYIIPQLPVITAIMIGLIIGILSQIGDLAASAIKRNAGIKDFGKLIPGHGGILDRIDSILFAAPTVYYILALFSRNFNSSV